MDSVASYIFVIVLLMACVEAVAILSLVKSRSRDDSVSKVLSLVKEGRDNSVSKEVAGLRKTSKRCSGRSGS